MPYCPKCGVQVEPHRQNCPLCLFPIPEVEEPEEDNRKRESYLQNRYRIKKAENRRRLREARIFVFIGTVISLLVVSLIIGIQDLYFSGDLTWSRYVITCNLAAVVSLFFFLQFIPTFLPNFLGLAVTAGGFLYLMDANDGQVEWFWDLGMAICANTMVWIYILRLVIRHSRRRGFNIPAYGLFAVALGCFSLELIHNFSLGEPLRLTWSLPVISALVPLGGLLLFLHFLLSPRIQEKIRRKLHL